MSSGKLPEVAVLFGAHADGVFTIALRILGDRRSAEDVVGETFEAVLKHGDSFRAEGSVRGWLFRIAYRKAIAVYRARRDVPTEPAAMVRLPGASASAEAVALEVELARVVEAAIASLSEPLRAAFVLRDVEELSTREVAQVLEVSESAVKMRTIRARLALREKLEPYLV